MEHIDSDNKNTINPIPIKSYDDFINTIVAKTHEQLKLKGYVYDDIIVSDNKHINIMFPSNNGNSYGASLAPHCAYASYCAAKNNTDADFDADAHEKLLNSFAADIAEAYNKYNIKFIKESESTLTQFDALCQDKEYILTHAYPFILDTNFALTYRTASTLRTPCITASNNSGNLQCSFEITSPDDYMTTTLSPDDINAAGVTLEELMAASLVNLNTHAYKNLRITAIYNLIDESALPFEISQYEIKKAITDLREALPDVDFTNFYLVNYPHSALTISSILLSQTAMLSAAKATHTKRQLLVIPSSDADTLITNIDNFDPAAIPDLLRTVAKIFMPSEDKIKERLAVIPPLPLPAVYNILSKTFEYHTSV